MKGPPPLFVDTFSLCQWLLEHFDREPGMLARTLCKDGLTLLESVTLALKGRQREERIEETDERLIILRMHLRLAAASGLLKEHQALFALECADRIGRQLGGWQRSLDES